MTCCRLRAGSYAAPSVLPEQSKDAHVARCRQESVIFKSFILESLYVFSFSYTHLFIYKHNRNLWEKQQILTFKKPEGISLQKLLRT